ncbi:MAG: HrpE/YscL family type III secretion apparatus protein [Chlamydiales bacterium]|nr:HrpE/YscL family type III secretion apparatus protein [Chlamydiales bacterium]
MNYFSLTDTESIQTHAQNKVIPADDFSMLISAKEALEKAQEEVEKKLETTKKQCQNLRKKAKEEGRNEGLIEFNHHLLEFENQIKTIRNETQRQVLSIALKAAKKIVNKELEVNPNVIVDIVSGALRPVTQYRHIKIYIHKDDKERIEKEKDRVRQQLDHVETFSIIERDDIEKGGCIIETEAGIIDASLENQWRALEAAFEKFMKPQ